MRVLPLFAVLLLVAGCGASAASSKTKPPASTSARQIHFAHAPAFTINPRSKYTATLETSDGTLTATLLPHVAPITVNNFVFLARHHFYDGVIFHRIIKGFMVQTGDPTGTGFGGPGYTFKDEKVTMPYSRGVMAMANSGANTNGSQFFIVVAPKQASLAPNYTIFGKVSHGFNVLNKLANEPVAPSAAAPNELSAPVRRVVLKKVTIAQSP